MEYIKYLMECKIGEKESYKNKISIFIVYMSRIFIKEENEIEKKTLKEK